MGDLGKIKALVKYGGKPKNLTEKWNTVGDLTATDAYRHYCSAEQGSSAQVEFIFDQTSQGYMAIPTRRYETVPNYVENASSSTDFSSPKIKWVALAGKADACITSDIVSPLIKNTGLELKAPASGGIPYDDSYVGPRWSIPRGKKIIVPLEDDTTTTTTTTTTDTETDSEKPDDYSNPIISQDNTCEDIWWAVETTSMSDATCDCVPFYVDVKFSEPLAKEQQTFFSLLIGDLSSSSTTTASDGTTTTTTKDAFELVFIEGEANAKLYDRGNLEKDADGNATPSAVSLQGNIAWDGAYHRIEFIPIAGRLLIRIDQAGSYVYARRNRSTEDETERIKLFFQKYPKIQAVGSNSQVVMMLGKICFAKKSRLITNLSAAFDPKEKTHSKDLTPLDSGTPSISNEEGSEASLFIMHGNEGEKIIGAFAQKGNGKSLEGADAWGDAAKNFLHGEVDTSLEEDSSGSSKNKHYVITLTCEVGGFGETASDNKQPNRFPVWFRLRGGDFPDDDEATAGESKDISDDVIEMNESFSSSDRYSCSHQMDVTLYNKNGTYNLFTKKSYAIQIGLAWVSGTSTTVSTMFTGITLNASSNLVAGKETITVHCEDYMFILSSTLMINSPYYDGMDGFNVVSDIASKANIKANDDSGTTRFFMPSGYSFLEPVKKYDSKSSLLDCILDVCKMGVKTVWFDADGLLHYSGMAGGIGMTSPDDITASSTFYLDPSEGADSTTVIDSFSAETKFNSTVNSIFIKAIDRASKMMIFSSDKAESEEDMIPFRKVMYHSVPELGSIEAVKKQMERHKSIVYKPIKGVNFKVASAALMTPMTFFEIKAGDSSQKYRLMGLNRSFQTDSNSITATINGEWFGA